MSDKKRKHAGEEGGRPSKRTQTETSGQAGIVKFSVLEDVGEWAPAIGKSSYQFVLMSCAFCVLAGVKKP
jgi:hypothetical protein